MTSQPSQGSSDGGSGWAAMAVVAAICGACVLFRLLRDVFSWAGLAHTLGMSDGTGLMWPTATAVTTWILLVEFLALAAAAHNYYVGRWRPSKVANCFFAHVTLLGWIYSAAKGVLLATAVGFTWVWSTSRPVPVTWATRPHGNEAEEYDGYAVEAQLG